MKIDVSDHALIRWLERVEGLDIDGVRERIRAKIAPAVLLGASSLQVDGMEFILESGVLTTVKPKKHHVRRSPRMREVSVEEEFG